MKRDRDEYLKELKNGNYENIIIDLRGNQGGLENNLFPVLLAINSISAPNDGIKFSRRIQAVSNGRKDYKSALINQARKKYYELN